MTITIEQNLYWACWYLLNSSNIKQNSQKSDSSKIKKIILQTVLCFLYILQVPCLILAFSICWLPYHAWHLAQISGVSGITRTKCSIIQDITICLAFFNSALNPVLNSIFLLNFKVSLLYCVFKSHVVTYLI